MCTSGLEAEALSCLSIEGDVRYSPPLEEPNDGPNEYAYEDDFYDEPPEIRRVSTFEAQLETWVTPPQTEAERRTVEISKSPRRKKVYDSDEDDEDDPSLFGALFCSTGRYGRGLTYDEFLAQQHDENQGKSPQAAQGETSSQAQQGNTAGKGRTLLLETRRTRVVVGDSAVDMADYDDVEREETVGEIHDDAPCFLEESHTLPAGPTAAVLPPKKSRQSLSRRFLSVTSPRAAAKAKVIANAGGRNHDDSPLFQKFDKNDKENNDDLLLPVKKNHNPDSALDRPKNNTHKITIAGPAMT